MTPYIPSPEATRHAKNFLNKGLVRLYEAIMSPQDQDNIARETRRNGIAEIERVANNTLSISGKRRLPAVMSTSILGNRPDYTSECESITHKPSELGKTCAQRAQFTSRSQGSA